MEPPESRHFPPSWILAPTCLKVCIGFEAAHGFRMTKSPSLTLVEGVVDMFLSPATSAWFSFRMFGCWIRCNVSRDRQRRALTDAVLRELPRFAVQREVPHQWAVERAPCLVELVQLRCVVGLHACPQPDDVFNDLLRFGSVEPRTRMIACTMLPEKRTGHACMSTRKWERHQPEVNKHQTQN